MRRLLFCFAGLFLFGISSAQQKQGEELYIPKKLEYAALEMQARYGRTATGPDGMSAIDFIEQSDGITILCLLQYTSSYPAAALRVDKDTIRKVFNKYRETRNWSWLRLRFREEIIEPKN